MAVKTGCWGSVGARRVGRGGGFPRAVRLPVDWGCRPHLAHPPSFTSRLLGEGWASMQGTGSCDRESQGMVCAKRSGHEHQAQAGRVLPPDARTLIKDLYSFCSRTTHDFGSDIFLSGPLISLSA